MKFSVSEENYIKSIYHLQSINEEVSATMLAAAVNTKAASVTDMLKKLQAKKLFIMSHIKTSGLLNLVIKLPLRLSGNIVYGNISW